MRHFQSGLRVTHEGDSSHNVVLGHSYGTTVIGQTASEQAGLNADDLVLVASPGAEVGGAKDLNITGGDPTKHVWATTAKNDFIQNTGLEDIPARTAGSRYASGRRQYAAPNPSVQSCGTGTGSTRASPSSAASRSTGTARVSSKAAASGRYSLSNRIGPGAEHADPAPAVPACEPPRRLVGSGGLRYENSFGFVSTTLAG
ncbi:alpha/beta hydrolase [Plantactinospora solaniradicis]|uniref:Alpha/beta hydrolase n=1 Tax=Plantactinospora solaniradicis TaxID=1723736 RepID=A0ABW1K2W5_9ACTN